MGDVSNEALVNKGVITTDAIAVAGKLNPAQSNKFIDYVFDLTSLKNNARIVRFTNESMEIDKIGVGARVAMAKSEAKDPKLRRGIRTSKITLTPREVMTPFEIGDTFAEVNIEGRDVEDTVVRLMATQTGNDLEELYSNGNTLGPAVREADLMENGSTTQYVKDTYLGLIDGWIKRAMTQSHAVDIDGQNIGLSVFGKILRALPIKFRRSYTDLRWFMSPDLWSIFQEKLSSRATAVGDAAATSTPDNTPGPFGIKAVPVPLWAFNTRITEHVTLTGTTQVALQHKNITDVVVTPSTLAKVLTTPYVETTDYVVDYDAGKINRAGAGGITSGATVKVTYSAPPMVMLTHKGNLIIAIGREIRIEKDRDIYAGANQYAITTKVDCQFEETDAVSIGYNIGQGL